jgi:uncharacterized surface protein with fasciclin (FAS1) repeats
MEMASLDLSVSGAFTLLAPTNTAFISLPQSALASITADPEAATGFLELHVLVGIFTVARFTPGEYETLAGVTVTIDTPPVTIEGITLDSLGFLANNGIMFKIAEVLSKKSK